MIAPIKIADLENRMQEKGWTRPEVSQTLRILERGKTESITDKIVYWTALIITIILNMVISAILVPFLLVMDGVILMFTLLLLGLGFGAIFEYILCSIEKLNVGDLVVAGVFIPAIALINVYVITYLSNILATAMKLQTHSPLLVSVFYAGAFIIPYLVHKIKLIMMQKVN